MKHAATRWVIAFGFLFAALCGTALAQMGGGMGPGGGFGSGGHGDTFENLPGWRGHELEHNIILPQVAVGPNVAMTLIFTNMGGPERMGWFENDEDYTVTGTLRFFDDGGSALPVQINGVTGAEFPLSLNASEVTHLEVSADGGDLRTGWLHVEIDDAGEDDEWGFMNGHPVIRGERVMVSAYYSIFENGVLESQVAVRPATFSRGFFNRSLLSAQFEQTSAGLVRTGLAVVNTSDEEAQILLRLLDKDGTEFDEKVLTLGAGQQLAQFVDELFNSPPLPDGFLGSLELSTDAEGIVSMGLLQTGTVTTSLPSRHYGSWQRGR